jgi:hypothetical protein
VTAHFQQSEFACRCCGHGAAKPKLIAALEWVRRDWGQPMTVTSGFRCAKHNAEVGGAPNSAHLTGDAADISDAGGAIRAWMTEDMLAIYGLWAEDYWASPGWIHLQIRPAYHRIFVP